MVRAKAAQTEFIRVRLDKQKHRWILTIAKKNKLTISDVLRQLIAKEMACEPANK